MKLFAINEAFLLENIYQIFLNSFLVNKFKLVLKILESIVFHYGRTAIN